MPTQINNRRNTSEEHGPPQGSGPYAGRLWFPFFWIAVLIVGVFVIWFVWSGASGRGSWMRGISHASSLAITNPRDSAVLMDAQKSRYVGEHFYFRDLPVRQVVNPYVLFVGPENKQATLLVLTGSTYDATHYPISPGDRISISGIVKKAPTADVARQNWQLSGAAAQQLEQQQAYLQGISLAVGIPAQKNGNG